MAFGTGSEELFIEGQDFMIVWLARVITENRAGVLVAAANSVAVIAAGSWTDVIYKHTPDYRFKTTSCGLCSDTHTVLLTETTL